MKRYIRSQREFAQYIYHGTDIKALCEIIESNELRAGISNETETYGISFTRNPRESYGSVDLVVDRYELMQNYHLEPVYRDGIAGLDLAEERCNRTIKNIRKYLKQVRLTNRVHVKHVARLLRQQGVDTLWQPRVYPKHAPRGFPNDMYYFNELKDLCRKYAIPVNNLLQQVFDSIDDALTASEQGGI